MVACPCRASDTLAPESIRIGLSIPKRAASELTIGAGPKAPSNAARRIAQPGCRTGSVRLTSPVGLPLWAISTGSSRPIPPGRFRLRRRGPQTIRPNPGRGLHQPVYLRASPQSRHPLAVSPCGRHPGYASSTRPALETHRVQVDDRQAHMAPIRQHQNQPLGPRLSQPDLRLCVVHPRRPAHQYADG